MWSQYHARRWGLLFAVVRLPICDLGHNDPDHVPYSMILGQHSIPIYRSDLNHHPHHAASPYSISGRN